MADAIAVHMKANGVKTMGYIGFRRCLRRRLAGGDQALGADGRIKVVAEEKYNRADPSVTGQVLKLVSANPDAILIGAAGTPARTPQKELVRAQLQGKVYQTHGVANPDFLRVVGKDGDGTVLPSGPMLVYEQLPDSNPVKKVAAEYIAKYEQSSARAPRSGGTPTTLPASHQGDSGCVRAAAPRNSARRCATRWRPRPWVATMACCDDADRSQWPRQPGPRDGEDRQRQVTLTK